MKSDMRNEIKAHIVRQGMTMQEVIDLLAEKGPPPKPSATGSVGRGSAAE